MGVIGDHPTDAVKSPATFTQLDVRDAGELCEHGRFLFLGDILRVLAPHCHGDPAGIALENNPLRCFRIPVRSPTQGTQYTSYRYSCAMPLVPFAAASVSRR